MAMLAPMVARQWAILTYFGIPSPKMAKIKQRPCSMPGRD
jgi:hypothetical protein